MTSLYLLTHTAWGKRWFRIAFWGLTALLFLNLFNAWVYWLQH